MMVCVYWRASHVWKACMLIIWQTLKLHYANLSFCVWVFLQFITHTILVNNKGQLVYTEFSRGWQSAFSWSSAVWHLKNCVWFYISFVTVSQLCCVLSDYLIKSLFPSRVEENTLNHLCSSSTGPDTWHVGVFSKFFKFTASLAFSATFWLLFVAFYSEKQELM